MQQLLLDHYYGALKEEYVCAWAKQAPYEDFVRGSLETNL